MIKVCTMCMLAGFVVRSVVLVFVNKVYISVLWFHRYMHMCTMYVLSIILSKGFSGTLISTRTSLKRLESITSKL